MRKLLFLLALSALLIPQLAHGKTGTDSGDYETYLKWDFQGAGMPDGFKWFEMDGLFYALAPVHFGFSDDKPWIWAMEKEGSDNACMACFPYYMYTEQNPRKRSQDWIVTSGIYVTPKEGKLTWRSRTDVTNYGGAIVETFRGSYNVYISTKGQQFEDFPETPVFEMKGDSVDWYDHSIDVSEYNGQTIYVAFACQTLNEEYPGLVLVDDLALVGEQRLVQTEVLTDQYIYGDQDVAIRCKFTGATDAPVTSLKAHFSYAGQTFTKEMDGSALQKGESYTLEFDEKISLSVSDTARYRVWVEANGIEYSPENYEAICLAFKPERKIVIEDGSGMWCGYCAIGIPAMEKMKAKYPGQFIGIVVHRDDLLGQEAYDKALNVGDLPAAKINRKYVTSNLMVIIEENGKKAYTTLNGGIETYFLKELEETVSPVSLALTGGFTDATQQKITARADFKFALDYTSSDFRVAFVLIENNVSGEGFYQNNSYSAFDGDAGGLEKQPTRIINPAFQEVARGIYDFAGIPGSIPSQITASEALNFEYELTVPEMKKGPQIVTNNLELVAMIINAATGEIVNADKVMLGDPQGITPESVDGELKCLVRDGICTVMLPAGFEGASVASLLDLNGRTVTRAANGGESGNEIRIPVRGLSGVYLLRVISGGNTSVAKIVIG